MRLLGLMVVGFVLLLAGAWIPATQAAVPIAPIIDGDNSWLLGGVQGGRWLDAKTTAASLRGGERYRLVNAAGVIGRTTASKPESAGAPCEDTLLTTLKPAPRIKNALAIGGAWNPLPRAPRPISPRYSVYRNAVADMLRAQGIAQPDVRLTKVQRLDLEGDGVDEVLISATRLNENRPTPRINAGDYSLVVLRKLINGQVKTLTLAADYYPQAQEFGAPNEYTIPAVLDLNGDGKLEIVVASQYYEGSATTVYAISGTTVTSVLEAGCGA